MHLSISPVYSITADENSNTLFEFGQNQLQILMVSYAGVMERGWGFLHYFLHWSSITQRIVSVNLTRRVVKHYTEAIEFPSLKDFKE